MIFFLTEAIITTNSILMNQVSQDSIEKPEEPARSRHCVSERICRKCHWGNLGRRRGAMNWSQENCLINDHRLTCERRGGDLRLAPDRSASLRRRFGGDFLHFGAARGEARIFCSLFSHSQKGAAFILRMSKTQNSTSSHRPRTYALQIYSFHGRRRKCFQQKGDCGGELIFLMG